MTSMRELFLNAPAGQLDPALKPLISKWDDEPTGIQVLEVLDAAVHCGGASGFAISTLEILLNQAIQDSGTSYEALVAQAVWRRDGTYQFNSTETI